MRKRPAELALFGDCLRARASPETFAGIFGASGLAVRGIDLSGLVCSGNRKPLKVALDVAVFYHLVDAQIRAMACIATAQILDGALRADVLEAQRKQLLKAGSGIARALQPATACEATSKINRRKGELGKIRPGTPRSSF